MGGRRRRETRDSSGEDAARWAAWLVLLPVLLIALPALLLLPTLYFTFVALPVLALCLPVIWRTGAYLGGRLDRFHTADLIAVATVAVVAAVLWAWMVLEAERPDVPQLVWLAVSAGWVLTLVAGGALMCRSMRRN